MTDFLTNMVAKATDRAPLLRRRRPSLFEPPADTGAGALLRSTPLPRDTVESDSQAFKGQPRPKARMTDIGSDMAPVVSSGKLEPHPRPPVPVHARETASRSVSEEDVTSPALGRKRQAAPATDPRVQTQAVIPAEVNNTPKIQIPRPTRAIAPIQPMQALETIVEKQSLAPAPGLLSLSRPVALNANYPTAESLPSDKRQTKAVLGGPQEKSPEIVVSHSAPEKEVSAIVHAKPARSPERPLFIPSSRRAKQIAALQSPATRTEPPTINVTIGRIEVRATPAPSTPVRTMRRDPEKPSLEDYLRSRNRGNK